VDAAGEHATRAAVDDGSLGGVASAVVVIGDIGGHPDELFAALVDVGANGDTLVLPDDVASVVQVGDLIDSGPDSTGVLDLVERFRTANPGRWVQLVGNHEAAALGGPGFGPFGTVASQADRRRVRRWWDDGLMRIAVAVRAPVLGGDALITHAGVTRGFWENVGRPETASNAAGVIDRLAVAEPEVVFRAGWMLGGNSSDRGAGPVWASPDIELIPSWDGAPMPWAQVHGHASVWRWRSGKPASWSMPPEVRLDRDRRHAWVPCGGRVIVGIDPGLGQWAGIRWAPLVLPDASLDVPEQERSQPSADESDP
jgi:hypothetical protein